MARISMDAIKRGITRYESLPKPLKVIILALTIFGLAIFIFYVFSWNIRGWLIDSVKYYYLLYACFSASVFLTLPARKTERHTTKVPWYDLVFAALVFGICVYFSSHSWGIMYYGWIPPPHTYDMVLATILGVLALEGARRMVGIPFTIVCLLAGIYPLFAEKLPGVLYAPSFSFSHMINSFAFGKTGALGLPAHLIGDLLFGFLLLAGMLLASGAGSFFLNLALALVGQFRGGPAKVAVLASGGFGSLHGGVTANLVATGSVTIPAMKRMGYPPHYAAAIEACASSGGVLMPPVMGTVAFLMAIMTDYPYAVIISAAVIPAVLYYWGLMVQVDAYAGRVGLKGLPREELPSVLKTLKEGWQFIAVIVFLVVGLVYFRWGVIAPVYASGLLFLFSFFHRQTMMTSRRLIETIASINSLIVYVMAIMLPVGFIMTGLTVTGALTALTAKLVTFGEENIIGILLIAMVTCYLFGMVGIAVIPYIVLAVTALPALVGMTGLNLLGLHLFMVYYLMTSGITPPVAIVAFVAAGLAGGPAMKTAVTSMRLAVVLYFIPFLFLFHPALILQGPISETLYLFALCLLGILILAGGLEGYLLKVGRLSLWSRPLLVIGGFLIAFPDWKTTIAGAILTPLVVAIILIRRRITAGKLIANSSSGGGKQRCPHLR